MLGRAKRVNMLLVKSQQIIASQSDLQSGVETVSGTIHKAVQTEVRKTGSNRLLPASIIASLKGMFSFRFEFI